MAMIDNNEIEAIRQKANIVDIISSYISLTPKGKNYFGVCPFHEDHSPSLCVSSEKSIYTCWACGNTGNVFTFVQNFENVGFVESVKIVAEKIGYNISIDLKKNDSKYSNLYDAMNLSLLYYKNNLKTKLGESARKYLLERQLDEKVIDDFDIGLSLNNHDGLFNLLSKKGFSNKDLENIGLINIDGANIFDSFINRILFPIHNIDGQVVGYTGRIYNNEAKAKYFNSRESVIFRKGHILFNYHRAKDYIKELREVIIVEGNMDAIRMYSSGFKNTIALMGTSLTKDQVDIIKKLRSKVILMFDNDNAGELATINNGAIFEKEGIETYVVRLSDYKDPDDYIKYKGIESMSNCIKGKMSFTDFKLHYYKKNKNLDNPNDMVAFVKEIINSVKDINDNLTKEITLQKLSEQYHISYDLLKDEISLDNISDKKDKILGKNKQRYNIKKYDMLCEVIIYYMINDSAYIQMYKNQNLFITNAIYRNIINEILCFYEKYNNISSASFISYISLKDDIKDIVLRIIGNNDEELIDKNFIRYLINIEKLNAEDKIKQLKEEIRNTLDINKKTELTNKLIELKKGSVKNERN